jgi:hypothetical protein
MGHNPLPWMQEDDSLVRGVIAGDRLLSRRFSPGPVFRDIRGMAVRRVEAADIASLAGIRRRECRNRALGIYEARLGRAWQVSSTCSIRTSSFWAAAYRTSPDCIQGSAAGDAFRFF